MHEFRHGPTKIREKQTVPLNFFEDESTPCSPNADPQWGMIEFHLREFWERCQECPGIHGEPHLDDLSAIAGLAPIVNDLLWLRPVAAKTTIPCSLHLPDFVYDYVGHNVCEGNGRDFEGDRILGRAMRNVSDNGGAGLQAELYTRMTIAIATGQVLTYRGAMVNANKKICEIRVRLLPVAIQADRVTDLIGAATIKRARTN